MSGFEWSSDTVYASGGKKRDKLAVLGVIVVQEDGSLSVQPEDDYYCGKIHALDARHLADEILKPYSDARTAGYNAYTADPSDVTDAQERGLYPEDQDLRIEWGAGWLQAQIEAEIGIDVNLYAKIGGAGMGTIQDAIRKLKQGAGR